MAFLVLAVTGLYLWWPRQWTTRILRSIALLNGQARGKARDWNWHNAVGLWSAPILIVLTVTALPISYRWAGNLIYTLTGTLPPLQGQGPNPGGPAIEISPPTEGSKPLAAAALFAIAQKEVPAWEQITLRPSGGGGPRSGGGAGAQGRERKGETERRGPQAVVLTVKEKNAWPRFASVQLSLDPFTGAVLRREGYADYNTGRKVRSWTRFLHTGEALGKAGQGVAGLASFGGAVLVYTGVALAWRRFFKRKRALDMVEEPQKDSPDPVTAV